MASECNPDKSIPKTQIKNRATIRFRYWSGACNYRTSKLDFVPLFSYFKSCETHHFLMSGCPSVIVKLEMLSKIIRLSQKLSALNSLLSKNDDLGTPLNL